MYQATLFFCKIGIKNKKLNNEITIREVVRITDLRSMVSQFCHQQSTDSAEILAQFSVTFYMTNE